MSRLVRVVLLFIAMGLLVATLTIAFFWQWLSEERDLLPEEKVYFVPKGTSLYKVAYELEKAEVIAWPRIWVLYAKVFGLTEIKAGEYLLPMVSSPLFILQKLNRGDVIHYSITFVEGLKFSDFLQQLHAQENIKKEIVPEQALQQLNQAGVEVTHLEGWFYPDTYQYSLGDSDLSILLRAHNKMHQTLAEAWTQRAEDLPFDTPYEALILASIIEKETGVEYERDEIAGVFVRRLQKGMRLQTDPTVIYGMGENYRGKIALKDLRAPTPYNTYSINGLPPTPIAMPGREAIFAAVRPKSGSSLYFVARGDGSHQFSDTLEEHNRAVHEYQKKRRADYRSSPTQKNSNQRSPDEG